MVRLLNQKINIKTDFSLSTHLSLDCVRLFQIQMLFYIRLFEILCFAVVVSALLYHVCPIPAMGKRGAKQKERAEEQWAVWVATANVGLYIMMSLGFTFGKGLGAPAKKLGSKWSNKGQGASGWGQKFPIEEWRCTEERWCGEDTGFLKRN